MAVWCQSAIWFADTLTQQRTLNRKSIKNELIKLLYLLHAGKCNYNLHTYTHHHEIFHWPLTLLLVFECQLKRMHACVWGCVVVCVSGTAPLCPTQSIPLHSTRPHQNKQLHQAPKMRTRLSTVAGSPKKPLQTFWGCISDLVSQMILYIHSCTCQTPNTLIFSTGFSSQRSVAKVKPSTVLWHHQQRVQ